MRSEPPTPHGEIIVTPTAAVPWVDLERVFGTRGDPAHCWCQYFKMPNSEWRAAPTDEKAAMLREQTEEGNPAPGLIAYLGDEPVGWCAVEPRQRYPRVLRSQVAADSTEPADDPAVWAISCFVVRVGHRRRGVAAALIIAAVGWARENGARVIEGYPVEPAERSKPSSAELYHGTVSLFEGAGFTIVSRPTPSRALVRLELA